MPSLYYRTSDGKADYDFSFEQQREGDWLVFIEDQPSYQGRYRGCLPTHRLMLGDRYYVCWTTRLATLDEARQVAALWADKTQEYIRTGRRF